MCIKEAIVLAGGMGTRLQGVLPDIPKCMAPVHGKPFLTYVLDYLAAEGINKVILSVAYLKDQIINYFGYSYKSISISYAIETELLGTGGAIQFALSQSSENEIFVLNGDTYFNPSLAEMEKQHFESNADATIAVKSMTDTKRYGLVVLDRNGRITEFREKDPTSAEGWINGGIYLLNRSLPGNTGKIRFSIENDIFKTMCLTKQLFAFKTNAFFIDIGIPGDYKRAHTLIKPSEL